MKRQEEQNPNPNNLKDAPIWFSLYLAVLFSLFFVLFFFDLIITRP
jgi:ABC-type protease/lipase transport system fused ATPase/permease subunit